MKLEYILIFITSFLPAIMLGQKCNYFTQKEDNKITISCENGEKLMLKFLDESDIKFWYDPTGKFNRNNESFAVVNEEFDSAYKIDVEESNTAFEIFTDDLRVVISKEPLRVQIYDKYQRLILGDAEKNAFSYTGSNIQSQKILQKGEKIFGLGEKSGKLNRRGNAYTMWNSDKPCYSVTEDPLYKSIPFFISSKQYGIFLDNTYKTEFDIGQEFSDKLTFSVPNGPFVYYFFHGDNYKEIISKYIKLTGKPIIPPKWALGFSQSRGLLTNEKLTRDIAREYRKRGIPSDIIYQDIDWVDGLQNFEWDKENYDNPKKMLKDLGEEGFKVIVSQDPVISQATENQWDEAESMGYLAKDSRTGEAYDMPWPWGGNAGVVDFTNPDVEEWWGKLQQKPIDDGVKGFWTDMGEPAWSNEDDKDRLYMKHYKGMHDEIHNVYGLEWDRVVKEQFEKRNPNQRIFQMTRSAFSGMQRYTFGWSGDSGNSNDVSEGWENFANQIPMALSAGMGGIPFWATDISGYCGDIEDYDEFAELYVRWLQFGAFNPLSRIHHEGNNAVEPWLFGKEVERISRSAIERKYELLPYIYSYVKEARDTGIPPMRAMFLAFPKDEEVYNLDHQFMFGENILVAPVTEEGIKFMKIYLPKGEWVDYNNPKTVYEGKQYINYPTPLEITPIFVKEGSIIPKMPVMPYINAMKNAPLILEVFPSNKDSEFTVYEDDGVTNDYRQEIYSTTTINTEVLPDSIKVIVNEPDTNGYETENRNIWLEVHLDNKPQTIRKNGKDLNSYTEKKLQSNWNTSFDLSGFTYSEKEQILYVRFPDEKDKIEIKIIK